MATRHGKITQRSRHARGIGNARSFGRTVCFAGESPLQGEGDVRARIGRITWGPAV